MCIDDFALKKRHRYGTIMIDINTHKIVDMIESRKEDDVIEWLRTFPNLSIVCRDGSLTYKDAIDKAHPDIIQVSDKFHLLKNLTDYCCKYMKSIMKNNIEITCKKQFSITSLREGNSYGKIYELIKVQGYDGCESLLREYLLLELRNEKLYKKESLTEVTQR